MNDSLKFWLGQVTTGHGFMIIAPTLLSALSGTISWTVATPLLVAGVIGLVWPENTELRSASQDAASDIARVVAAYMNRGIPPSTVPTTAK